MGGWDDYINANVVNDKRLDKAVLIDLTGQSTWGKSADIELSPEEMNRIAFAFNNAEHAQANGIAVSGKKYVVNMVQDLKATYKKPDTEEIFEAMIPTLISRGGKEGVIAAKCKQSILVSHYPEPITAVEAVDAALDKAIYLIIQGL